MSRQTDKCGACGSPHLTWRSKKTVITGEWRELVCADCGYSIAVNAPAGLWALFLIAAVAALYGWFTVLG